MDALAHIGQILTAFLQDTRLHLLIALIVIDVVFGVWAAKRTGSYDSRRVLEFYDTKLLPMVGAYLTLYVVGKFIPEAVAAIGDGVIWTAFVVMSGLLLDSIRDNFKTIFGMMPEPPLPPNR